MNPNILDFPIFRLPDQKLTSDLLVGSNSKGILIVYLKSSNQQDDLELLKKILKAVDLSFDDDICSLGITDSENLSFGAISEKISFKTCLVFGIKPASIGLRFDYENYKAFNFRGIQFLCSDSIEIIAKDKELKSALWKALQEIFLK